MRERIKTGLGIVLVMGLASYINIEAYFLVAVTISTLPAEINHTKRKVNPWSFLVVFQMLGLALPLLLLMPTRELVWVMLIVGVGDTAAIFGGKFLNPFPKWRPFPNISKGKTVFGYLYGTAAAVTTDWVFNLFWPVPLGGGLLSVILYQAAASGDLCGSKWKRSIGLKDSGEGLWTEKLLAGHGGMIDRFGALAMALWAWLVICIMNKLFSYLLPLF